MITIRIEDFITDQDITPMDDLAVITNYEAIYDRITHFCNNVNDEVHLNGWIDGEHINDTINNLVYITSLNFNFTKNGKSDIAKKLPHLKEVDRFTHYGLPDNLGNIQRIGKYIGIKLYMQLNAITLKHIDGNLFNISCSNFSKDVILADRGG